MKKLFLIAAAFITFSAFTVINDTWTNDDPHSQLGFTVTHLGISDVSGTFNDFDVTVKSVKPDFSDASFELTAKTASIDTRVEARNNHLKSADFFDVAKYPTAKFEITKVETLQNDTSGTHKISGNLTLKDSTKNITFPARVSVGDAELKATANFNIDRNQWGIHFNNKESLGNNFIRPEVNLTLNIAAKK